MTTLMPTKECTGCHATLPLDVFYLEKAGGSVRRTWCKHCEAAKRRDLCERKALVDKPPDEPPEKPVEKPPDEPPPLQYRTTATIDRAERAVRVEVYRTQVAGGQRITFFTRKVG